MQKTTSTLWKLFSHKSFVYEKSTVNLIDFTTKHTLFVGTHRTVDNSVQINRLIGYNVRAPVLDCSLTWELTACEIAVIIGVFVQLF